MNALLAQIRPFMTTEVLTIVIAIMMAVATLSAVYLVASINIRARGQRKDRLHRAAHRVAKKATQADSIQLLRQNNDGKVDRFFTRLLPKPERLRERLNQTGRRITPGQYAGAIIICCILFFLLIWRAGGLAPATALICGIGAGIMVPHFYIGFLVNRRKNKFLENLADGVDVMVRGIKAGLPVSVTVQAVAQEAVSPVKEVFADVADRIRMGVSIDEAFIDASNAIAAPEMKFLAITLSVQKETGGNLAETLENLSEILRKRRQMKLKIKAVSSEARASATILGSLPFVMFGILLLVNPGYATELFHDPRGHVLLALGLMSMFMGIGVMMKMVRFEI